jgi:hypothetical protein
LQVDRGHAEVGVTKLALDHVQRHTFRAGHVDATSAAITSTRRSYTSPAV